MELYQQLLIHLLKQQPLCISFPDLKLNASEIVELQSYQALKKIKAILENDALEDRNCFLQIEEIICLFEQWDAIHCARHDFG